MLGVTHPISGSQGPQQPPLGVSTCVQVTKIPSQIETQTCAQTEH